MGLSASDDIARMLDAQPFVQEAAQPSTNFRSWLRLANVWP
jgi:hypothetical protein